MTIPIALQLYSVREAMKEDFPGVMRRIADIGYIGVEPILDLPGTTIARAADTFRELGLKVPSAHSPLPVGADQHRVLDYAAAFDCKRIIPSTNRDSFKTIDLILKTCDQFNEASAVASEYGITVGVHNHYWEFEQVEGRYAFHVMLENLDPAVFFQIDTYWVQTAGLDPARIVNELASRAPLLHIKDGPAVQGEPMVAVGEGVLDFESIVQAAEGFAEWLIVELDTCASDMLEAIEQSYRFLVRENLAFGRNT